MAAPNNPMPHGLDHIVHVVADLDRAADVYRTLGFTVGAENRHPWGTSNRLVQLPGCFVELLAIARPDQIAAHAPQTFSFGAFNRDFLARGQGLSMLALESGDAAKDADKFRAAGFGGFDLLRFERAGRKADGSEVTVGFSLAFAVDPRARDIGFFVCQQHQPQNFWDPALQVHANGVSTIASVVLVAENPADHHVFLSMLAGERNLHVTSAGMTVPTPRGAIEVMTPVAFQVGFGVEPPDLTHGARLAAVRFVLSDVVGQSARLRHKGIATRERSDRLVVPDAAAHGATLVFEPKAGGG
jgi:catechol 2,3-dioxygenase-like lactoylglutathione lyase family enzyme